MPVAIVLAAGGGVLWTGWQRTGTGLATGAALNGASLPAGDANGRELRVATFNIRGGLGQNGTRDLDLTASCLGGLDLVGLNEVHGLSPTEARSQVEELSGKLGMAWLFLPSERRWWHESFGNGVLSRLPVTHWARRPLPCTKSRGFRNVTVLDVALGERTVHVLITHLDTRKDREVQLREVSELFLSLAEPAILMGDMNSTADDPQIQNLLRTPGVVDPVGQALGGKTPPRIDWIFARGLKCLDAGLVDRKASDHPMVWAKLEVPQ